MNPTNRLALRGLCAVLALPGALLAAPAFAQPTPAQVAPAAPGAPHGPVSPVAAAPVGTAARPAVQDPLAIALAAQPGGLTPAQSGEMAGKTKRSVRVKSAELEAASARVDQAFISYFPRLSVSATYTRLSNVPGFSLGSGALVGAADDGLLKVGACPDGPGNNCVNVSKPGVADAPVGAKALTIDPVLNSTAFVASLAVPISDYVFRISQGYSAASHSEKSKRVELEAEGLQAAADAKVAYYNWLRARGSVVVTKQAVDQSRAHVEDANKTFAVGLISKADVLRLEAQLAGAQQTQAETESLALLTEEQLRILLLIPVGQPLAIGADVMHEPVDPVNETLPALQDQALARRLEIRALDETELSLKDAVSIARAGYLPRLDAFADATMANPNQRVFPSQNRFDGTWDAGVRLSWTLNDSFVASGATAEAKARLAGIAEQKNIVRDGLRLEVVSAYADMQKSLATIEASERQLTASEESLRVRNELFKNGKATSVELVDGEAEVTRARLGRLNARIGLAVARVRLDHATGRDVAARPVGAAE
ncbi:MAG: TolC family protein [Byssovorax sp.]